MEERMGPKARTWLPVSVIALAIAFAAPQVASAAVPTAVTGGAAPVTFSTALLHGTVNPNGHATSYFFQYGTTILYGAQTPAGSAGSGRSAITVVAGVGALVPNTTYHYRLVAQYSGGVARGKDRTFKTRRQPLGLSAAAVPNPVPFGAPLTISGTLSGTANANRAVVLQFRPFPYTTGFTAAANTQLTNAQGGFSFPGLSVPISSQYQVYLRDAPRVASPIITVGVAFRVTGHSSSRHVRRGTRVRFSGRLAPGLSGVEIVIQRRHRRHWSTLGRTLSRHRSGASTAKFSKRIRIRRGGSYRVEARGSGGNYVTGDSTPFTIRSHR
jgi:hypothetical protein